MEWQPISFDALLTRTRLPIASLALALEELQHVGHVVAIHGCFERTGRPS
jgi:predicted Rossmann fold nucleotide-binding protein DprA/Smf involved in DNA uptake